MASTTLLATSTATIPSSSTRNGSSLPSRNGSAMAVSLPVRRDVVCAAAQQERSAGAEEAGHSVVGRREALATGGLTAAVVAAAAAGPAWADFDEDYKAETQAVIERVKNTLALEKTDPSKADAVATLRQSSNDWVAKYRREKSVSGKVSFSNMYSVLNAISGHYISFGPNYPIPVKRKDRILEEIRDAEKALKRGR